MLTLFKKPSSENRQRIEWRSHALVDAKRRCHKQEFIAIQASGLLGGPFEIEVVENADTHRDQRQLMKRQTDGLRKAGRCDVIRPVGSDERYSTLLDEVSDIGVIAGKTVRVRPRTQRCAPLPPARIQKDDVTGGDLNAFDFSNASRSSLWMAVPGSSQP